MLHTTDERSNFSSKTRRFSARLLDAIVPRSVRRVSVHLLCGLDRRLLSAADLLVLHLPLDDGL